MYNARAGVILLYSTIFYDTKLLVFWCLGRGMPNHPIDCYCNGQVAPKGVGPTSRSLIFQGRGFSLTSPFCYWSYEEIIYLGGGNSNIFYVHPYLGFHDPIWRAYFSDGWFNHQPVYIFAHLAHLISTTRSLQAPMEQRSKVAVEGEGLMAIKSWWQKPKSGVEKGPHEIRIPSFPGGKGRSTFPSPKKYRDFFGTHGTCHGVGD